MTTHDILFHRDETEHLVCLVRAATPAEAIALVDERWEANPGAIVEDDLVRVIRAKDYAYDDCYVLVGDPADDPHLAAAAQRTVEVEVPGNAGGPFLVERNETCTEAGIFRVQAEEAEDAVAILADLDPADLFDMSEGDEPEDGVVVTLPIDVHRPNLVDYTVTCGSDKKD